MIVCCAAFTETFGHNPACGAEFHDGCDTSQTSWEVRIDDTQVQLLDHRRYFQESQSGEASEYVRLNSSRNETEVRLDHQVDASRVHDDLRATVWVRANKPGAILSMQVRLPHQIDPQTRRPLLFEIRGKAYTQTNRWEQLTVSSTDVAVEQQLMLLRGRLAGTLQGQTLDKRDAQIDRISLIIPINRGGTELLVDELRFGPLVSLPVPMAGLFEEQPFRDRQESPIRLEPNRLLVDNKPFFLRFAPFHGENLDALQDMGLNTILISRYDEQILIDELARRDMWVMTAPPQPALTAEGGFETSANAGMMPIPASTARILFWMLGTRIPADELRNVERWSNQTRDADRSFARPRPIIADVVSHERAFSRKLSMLGSSRHILHTSVSPREYRDYLRHKKNMALPDRFSFTWIATEAATPNILTRHPSRHRPIVVEPEQIWMQAWTAISVGHRGIGFWKTGALDEETPAARERRLAISLLNALIDLLEPWLATGKVVDTIPVSIQTNERTPAQRSGSRFLPSMRHSPSSNQTIHPDIQAAVIESEYGKLVIPLWYEDGAQFQPGRMAANGVSFVVPGVEHARAWEVTTTSVRPLDLTQPVAGGMEFRLPMMDQFAFVIITNDLELEARLTQRMRTVQQRCARLWVELARARLDRVRPTHEQLQRLASRKLPDAEALLRSAGEHLDRAEVELQAEHYNDARNLSRYSLQLLRRLQRAHWDNAVAGLTSPVSSPHTLCFETLPDHWRMIAAIGRSVSDGEQNLLRSGDFEDYDTVKADNWKPVFDEEKNRAVELHTDAASGQYALRIVSRPEETEISHEISSTPNVSVFSPRIPVSGGQVVIVSGLLRVQEQITGHPDGFMLYDNVKGTVGALRWHEQTPAGKWQQFRLIREVARSQDFQLIFELNGDGDVRLDDLRVVTLNPVITASGIRERPNRPRRNLLDFTPSLPKFQLWPARNTDPTSD